MVEPRVSIEPWGEHDMVILERSNTSEMTVYLGGPETPDQLEARHQRYLSMWATGDARMFRIMHRDDAVGGIGYWRIDRRGVPAYEIGWSVHTPFQGKGIAGRALALCIDDARAHRDPERTGLFAFPLVSNTGSNRLCERAGFTFLGEEPFEYPRGNPIVVNAWRLALDEGG
ncbi:MAG TPA: GNAT family N-acetyltransferase [Microbacterium sp.]|uniref:GNAT family N-acetyltransferase n=1 Tax=Microbacterium sp. TaxID=51671 RepID=UPI002BD188D4|nr:GNAT family N-acetyltransferase [Microbacterium sp.]HWI30224.1 GNAT family N-acetyltransferase [Microbacterium sp.]